MSTYKNKGIWKVIYAQLRDAGPDTFFKWGDLEGMTNKRRDASRGALTRARQELECMDGMTVCGQCAAGFWVRRQEHA